MSYKKFTSQLRALDSEEARLLAIEKEMLPAFKTVKSGYIGDEKACRRMRNALLKILLGDLCSGNLLCQQNHESRLLEAVPMAASLLSKPSVSNKTVALMVLEQARPSMVMWEHMLLNSLCRELSDQGSDEGACLMLGYLSHNMPHQESLVEAVVPAVLALLKKGVSKTTLACYSFLATLTDYQSEYMKVSLEEAMHMAEAVLQSDATNKLSWKGLQGTVVLAKRLLASPFYRVLVTRGYVSGLLRVWNEVVAGSWPEDFDTYHGVLNPFLQISVLQLVTSCTDLLSDAEVAVFQEIITRYLHAPRRCATSSLTGQPDENYSNIRASMLIECSMVIIENPKLHTPALLDNVIPRIFHLIASPGGRRSLMIGFSKMAVTLYAPIDMSAYLPKLRSTIVPIISNLAAITDNSIALEGCRLAIALLAKDMVSPQVVVLTVGQCMDRFSFEYDVKAALLQDMLNLLRERLSANAEGISSLLFFVCDKMGLLPLGWLMETGNMCYRTYVTAKESVPSILLLFGRSLRQYHSYNVVMLILIIVGQMLRSSIDIFLTSTAAYISIDNLRNLFQQIAVTYNDTHTERQTAVRDGYAALCLIILALNTVTIEPIETMAESLGAYISTIQRDSLKRLILESRSAEDVLSGLQRNMFTCIGNEFALEPYC